MRLRPISIVLVLTSGLLLHGCAPSMHAFYQDKAKPDPTSLCRAYLDPADTEQFRADLQAELQQRGVDPSDCQGKVATQNVVVGTAAAIGLATVVAIACSKGGCPAITGGGGGRYSSGYAWDEFYDQYGQLVWECRDRGNGQFADGYHCSGYAQIDTTWPSNMAPA